jgi:acetyl esterase/lipase
MSWVILGGFLASISVLVTMATHPYGNKEQISQHGGRIISRANIEYGNVSGHSLRMDAHVPNGQGPFPAAIIIHGGAWVTGDRSHTVQPLFQPLGFIWLGAC